MARTRDLSCTLTHAAGFSLDVPSITVSVTPPKGKGSVVEAPLGMTPMVIGSSPDCDLVIEDPSISRRHCQLSLDERGIRLRDLGSKNGTFIGGVEVIEVLLAPEIAVTIGGSRLVARVTGEPTTVVLSREARFGEALGGSLPMRVLFAKLGRAAVTAETILLLGESGTGKELLARAIHDASPRREGPFVVFDCSAVAPTLVEAELFGYEKGAFTGAAKAQEGLFEQANGGTLFIDELGELPIELQPKLLRALEARETRRLGARAVKSFDARVVAATHRDLRARVAAGTFRQDLYYRLAVVEVVVPPLRERKDDIPLLVERFLHAQTPPRTIADLPPGALELLGNHSWPGNVRELRNAVARLVLFPDLGQGAWAPTMAPGSVSSSLGPLVNKTLKEAREEVVEQFERAYLAEKLKAHGGSVSRAADSMGVSRQFLHRLLDRYGMKGGER